jgi:hypothetical protein
MWPDNPGGICKIPSTKGKILRPESKMVGAERR